MKGITKGLVCGSMVMGLLLAGACTEEDLDKRAEIGYVEVALNWGSAQPTGKQFIFYPVDGGQALVYDNDAPECSSEDGFNGFRGWLPTGNYRMLVMNTDGANLEFRNMGKYETAEVGVVKKSAAKAGRSTQQEALDNRIEQAGNLMFAKEFDRSEGETGDPSTLTVPYQETVKKTAAPRLAVKQVRLYFKIDRPEVITACSGVFTGVSESLNFSTGRCSTTSASVDFDAAKPQTGQSYNFVAGFSALDLLMPGDAVSGIHVVYLTLTKSDGTTLSLSIDVTGAMEKIIEAGGGIVPIDIPLEVELKVLNDGTLQSDVRPWTDGTGSGTVVGTKNQQ